MINFVELAAGNTFIHENSRYIKLAHEVCDFHSLGGGINLRLNIETDDGMPAVARTAIVYNSVNLDNGQIKSFQSEDLIEADIEVEKDLEAQNFDSEENESYTF
tara:strand:+ start:559 stop:870 length:312 start_codon:yes stop_codon:yes gene_type:complete